MSWWRKLFGGDRTEESPAAPEPRPSPPRAKAAQQFPLTVEIIPDELVGRVFLHEIEAAGERIPCWSYVSDGLRAHEQKEVVVTLRRERGEAAGDYPEDPLHFFATLYRLAAQGGCVDVGGQSELGTRRFFGHHLLYADAQPLPGVALPLPCLTVVLINDEELRGVRAFGSTRVLSRMGHAASHYPFPTWVERKRRGVPLGGAFEKSVLTKLGLRISGKIVVSLHDNRITLGIQRELHDRLRDAQLPDAPLALIALRDPDANACLVWEPGQDEPTAISPPGSDGSRVSGAYAVVLGEQPHDGGKLFEDGFIIELTDLSWAKFRRALLGGTDLVLPATADDMDFALTWRDDIYTAPEDEESGDEPEPAPPLPGELEQTIVLLMPQDELGARVTTNALSEQIRCISAEVSQLYSRGKIQVSPMGVFVAVKPNRRVKVWVEGIEGDLSPDDAALVERHASAVTAPTVTDAITYVCAFPRKGAGLSGPPPLPQAWREASKTAGKALLLPDGMLAEVWPD